MALNVSADYKQGDRHDHVEVPLVEFKEDNVFIVFSPALDLSGYGKSKVEAKDSFKEALIEFMKYTSNKNSLGKALTELGWKMKGSKSSRKFTPPKHSDLIDSNPTYNDIIDNKEYSVSRENLALAY